MNYLQITKDSLRLFRSAKLVWVFGFLSLLISLVLPLASSLSKLVRGFPILFCLFYIAFLVIFLVSFIAEGGLIYAIHQAFLNKALTFSEAWSQSKSKIFRIIGLSFILGIPVILIPLFLLKTISALIPTSPILWFLALINETLISSFFTFGLCAIMIDDVKAWAAAWTSLLVTTNNFFRVFVITGGIFLIRLLLIGAIVAIIKSGLLSVELPTPLVLDYPTYLKLTTTPFVSAATWIFDLFLFPLETIILTFGYLKFTKEIAYPALSHEQTTA